MLIFGVSMPIEILPWTRPFMGRFLGRISMGIDTPKINIGLLLVSMLVLVACGGGGGGGDGGGGGATNIPRYAFVANSNDNSVSSYVVDADTGRLKYIGKVAAGVSPLSPSSVSVDPSGKYAYVVDFGGSVSQYTIGASGGLAAMAPATVAAGSGPNSISVDPSGKYAYVANNGGANVSQYTIGASGGLTAMVPATVAAGSGPASVSVDPSGKYAYVANNGGTVSQYTIGASGGLAAMVPATVAAGANPWSVTTTGTWQ